jgi:predicted Zn-dependent protease
MIKALILSFSLVDCVSYTHKPIYPLRPIVSQVYIDPNLPQSEVKIAINTWNNVLNGSVVLRIEPWQNDVQPPAIIIKASRSDAPMILASHTLNAIAITYPWTGSYPSSIIYLATDKIYGDKLTAVLLHEIGHAFGAEHMDNTLMQEMYDRSNSCVDKSTVHQVAKHLHLQEQYLNYCQK